MSKRRNDFQRLAGLARLLLRRQEPHGAHVVQPVGDLDHQHPRIAGHRDDHLADGLAFGGGAQHHLVQLGDAVDEVADLVAEVRGQLLQRVAGVLDGVVQQGGDQRGGVHAEFGEDVRDRQRVGDVRVAGAAHLVGVPLLGHLVGPLQQRQVGLREELAVHRDQRLEHRVHRAALRRHPPREPGAHPARREVEVFAVVRGAGADIGAVSGPRWAPVVMHGLTRALLVSQSSPPRSGARQTSRISPQMMCRLLTGSGSSRSRPLRAASSSTTAAPVTFAPAVVSSRMRGRQRAAGGQHVVDDHDVAAGQIDAVGGDFQRGRPVLQVVRLAVHRRRQFARLAHGEHADAELVGDRTADAGSLWRRCRRPVRRLRRSSASAAVTTARPCGSASTGVRSLNWMPGSGKSAHLAGQRLDDAGDVVGS